MDAEAHHFGFYGNFRFKILGQCCSPKVTLLQLISWSRPIPSMTGKEHSNYNEINQKTTKTLLRNLDAKRYALFRQIETHTIIDNRISQFEDDLSEIQKLTRSKIDDIDSYLSKKKGLRENDNIGEYEDADKEVDRDINFTYSKRSILSRSMTECPKCNEQVLTNFLDEHRKICSITAKRKANVNQTPHICIGHDNDGVEGDSSGKAHSPIPYDPVRPNPPRNLRVRAVDYSSMTIEWDTSIFDGGEPIVDYEVVYSMQPSPAHNIKRTKNFTEQCSRWCLTQPIPKNTFVIEGLFASTTYSDIKLRCKNRIGWSDFGSNIESVETAGK